MQMYVSHMTQLLFVIGLGCAGLLIKLLQHDDNFFLLFTEIIV